MLECPQCHRKDFKTERGLKRHLSAIHGTTGDGTANERFTTLARAVKNCFPKGIQTSNLRQLVDDLQFVWELNQRISR